MPLSTSKVDREPIHTRSIVCQSYGRSDGKWDIEGHLTDVKSYPFTNNFRGEIKPGEPLHDMWIRLTVDSKFIVQDVEVHTDAGPYQLCPSILPNFQKLKGLKIGPGWNRRVREKLSGVHGCAHLVDMLKPLATVALHTIQFSNSAPGQGGKQLKTPRPPINTCHVWSSDGEMIRSKYPDYYTGDKP